MTFIDRLQLDVQLVAHVKLASIMEKISGQPQVMKSPEPKPAAPAVMSQSAQLGYPKGTNQRFNSTAQHLSEITGLGGEDYPTFPGVSPKQPTQPKPAAQPAKPSKMNMLASSVFGNPADHFPKGPINPALKAVGQSPQKKRNERL